MNKYPTNNTLIIILLIALTFAFCTPKKETVEVAVNEKPNIGLQLYTVRDAMNADVPGTLKKVSDLGYTHIELASYDSGKFYGYEPAEFKKLALGLGLQPTSAHIALTAMAENPELVVSSSTEAGLSYIVMPWLNPEQRSSIENYKQHIEVINKIAPMCTAAGLTFAYHNHDFEFVEIDGQVPIDLILAETDPEHVKLELDLYWVSKVGIDPVNYLQKNGDRVILWHVKDMDDTPEQKFTEVGNGVINYTEIFKLRESTALEYFFIEQDRSDDPLKSIEVSYGNVAGILAN